MVGKLKIFVKLLLITNNKTLIISNDEMDNIFKIVKSLEDSGVF